MRSRDWRAILTGAANHTVEAAMGAAREEWGIDAGVGADGTVTARIDEIAETAALDWLSGHVPGLTLVSEEAGVISGDGDFTAIVDPVDGTRNAIRGVPYWAFSVGVFRDGRAVAALVRNVPAGVDYLAVPDASGKILPTVGPDVVRTSTVESLGRAAIGMQRPAYPGAVAGANALLSRVPTVRILGAAALDICLVGAGALDGYANTNTDPDMPFGERVVDYAAAAVFAGAAGGVVSDASGDPLAFPGDPMHRRAVVAAGTHALHDELLAALDTRGGGRER